MKFAPKTEKEFAALNLFPEGEYGFQVIAAADDVSKTSGKEMIVLDLMLFGPDGANRKVRDYLVPGTIYGDKKIFEFCRTCGIQDLYDGGSFTAQDCIDKTGYVKIGVEKGKESPKGGTFPDKNTVKWYVNKPAGVKPPPEVKNEAPAEEVADSDVPF